MSTLSVRRPLALLAVLGMVATLLFAVAGTASAATVTPSNPATFSACPDNADIPDAGFTDVPPGSFFDDAVNCLAYYGTTTGTTPDTYGPADDVTRAQMAVFLYRMAPEAGVVLDATPPDAGFTDISELSAEAQLAINSLADKGIVKGKTATTYQPAATVWRQQMALFLARFSDAASAPMTGPGGTQAKNVTGTTTNFTDLGNVTVEANTAIIEVFHLGVAAGTTATTFDPVGNVNRGQMSLFLTRLAAHMNVRPAGINIQAAPASGNDIVPAAPSLSYDVAVTSRTAAFAPAANTVVDQWNFVSYTGAALSTPFKTDGTCNTPNAQIYSAPGSLNPCVIDVGDSITSGDGNYEYSASAYTPNTYDLYAWTGATGAKFDMDTTTYSMVTVKPDSVADGFTFTLDPTSGLLKFGDTATWTVQVTEGGDAIAEAGWTFKMGRFTNNSEGQTTITDPFTTLTTDANGQATYTATYADPSSTVDNWQHQDVWVSTSAFGGAGAPLAQWDDDAAVAAKVVVSSPTEYKIINDPAPTANSATALVTDQYGNPMSGVAVLLTSDETDGLNAGNTVTTGSDGKASINYQWTSVNDREETITANAGVVGTTDFYWVYAAVTGENTGGDEAIMVRDEANKALVSNDSASDWTVWTWKAGDTFRIDGALKTQAEFETALMKQTVPGTYDYTQIDVVSYSTSGLSEFDLGT